jgi:hypothetical protein
MPPVGLLVLFGQNLAGSQVHKVDPLAGKTGDRLVIFRIVRNIFGDEALDLIAGVRAAVEERRHCTLPKARIQSTPRLKRMNSIARWATSLLLV